MKMHSIKFKITILYTGIVVLLFCLILGASYASARHYSESSIKKELVDEMKDFRHLILQHPEYLKNTDQMTFFDDHILLSIYDEEMRYIDGVLPDELPINVEFKENEIQTFHEGEDSLFVYDTKITFTGETFIWVRGIHTFNALGILFQRLLKLSAILLPSLIILTAVTGYHMINRSLRPVQEISGTVNKIVESSDLSVRLETPATDNEMHMLTDTFNHLLNHIEQQFNREQQFTSDAAHELRTPISAILSHCEYCLEEMDVSEELREELLIIRQKTIHMSELISQLLAIARAEGNRYQPHYEEVDVEILAETVLEELSSKASEKNIVLELENEAETSLIQADMEMVLRLLTNLVDNAISYGKHDGFVRVLISSAKDDVIIEVQDNGIGIPKEHLDKIWNRFYQVESSHATDNFGLGLFMVKYIVNCHNGEIGVTSEEGKGSTFTIVLPKDL